MDSTPPSYPQGGRGRGTGEERWAWGAVNILILSSLAHYVGTAVAKVISDLLIVKCNDYFPVLILLDLFVTFGIIEQVLFS